MSTVPPDPRDIGKPIRRPTPDQWARARDALGEIGRVEA